MRPFSFNAPLTFAFPILTQTNRVQRNLKTPTKKIRVGWRKLDTEFTVVSMLLRKNSNIVR